MMEDYVEQLTPPSPKPGEFKTDYVELSKNHMYSAYKRMNTGMLLVEIF